MILLPRKRIWSPRSLQRGFFTLPGGAGILGRGGGGGGGGGEATTILAKLTSWWELDESSGNRVDSHGGQDLSLSGTEAGTADGVRGAGDNAAVLAGNNHFFRDDEVDLRIPTESGNWCTWGWFYLASNTGQKGMISKWNAVNASGLERAVSVQSGIAYAQSGGSEYVNASAAAPAVSTWNFYVAWKDSDNYVRLRINDGATSVSPGTTSATPTGNQYSVGSFYSSSGRMTGRAQRVGWIKGDILTADEIAYLYNSGSSKTYTELVADA